MLQRGVAEDKAISIKFLMENKTDNPGILAEHGLSLYIENRSEGRVNKILFDAGATNAFIENAKVMGVDLAAVDFAVVSHGHYDHTGGFPAFCELNGSAPIYMHKNAFRESYSLRGGELFGPNDGIRWSVSEREMLKNRIITTDGPVFIDDDICITGSVVQEPEFEPTEKFYYRDESGEIIEDDMSHEQCLVIRRTEGLYVFSGCSHTGVVAAINTARRIFPEEKIAMLVAGMHLYNANTDVRKEVIERVVAENPDCVMPVHCTGIETICELKQRLCDRCVVAMAGDIHTRDNSTGFVYGRGFTEPCAKGGRENG